jgi:hypothetical protein
VYSHGLLHCVRNDGGCYGYHHYKELRGVARYEAKQSNPAYPYEIFDSATGRKRSNDKKYVSSLLGRGSIPFSVNDGAQKHAALDKAGIDVKESEMGCLKMVEQLL